MAAPVYRGGIPSGGITPGGGRAIPSRSIPEARTPLGSAAPQQLTSTPLQAYSQSRAYPSLQGSVSYPQQAPTKTDSFTGPTTIGGPTTSVGARLLSGRGGATPGSIGRPVSREEVLSRPLVADSYQGMPVTSVTPTSVSSAAMPVASVTPTSASSATTQPAVLQARPAGLVGPGRAPAPRQAATVAKPPVLPVYEAATSAPTDFVARPPTSPDELQLLRQDAQDRQARRALLTPDSPSSKLIQSEPLAWTTSGSGAADQKAASELGRERELESQLKEVIAVCGNLETELNNEKATSQSLQARISEMETQAAEKAAGDKGASTQQVVNLTERNEQLQAQLESVLAMCKELQERMQSKDMQAQEAALAAEQANQQLSTQFANSQGMCEQLQRELANSKAAIEELNTRLVGEGVAKQQLQTQLDSAVQVTEQLRSVGQAALAEAQSRSTANAQITEINMELSRVQSRNDELSKQLTDAMYQHGQAEAKLAAEAVKMGQLQAELAEAKTQARFSSSREVEAVGGLQSRADELEAQLEAAVAQKSDLQIQLDNALAVIPQHTDAIDALQSQNSALQSQLEGAQVRIHEGAGHAEMVEALQTRNGDMEIQLREALAMIPGHTETITVQQARIADLESQLAAAQQTMSAPQQQADIVAGLQERIAQLEGQLQDSAAVSMEAGATNAELQRQVAELENQLQVTRSPQSPSRLDNELRRQQRRCGEQLAEWENQLQSPGGPEPVSSENAQVPLEAENAELQRRVVELESQLQAATTRSPQSPQSPRQQSNTTDLEAQLMEAKELNESLQAKVKSHDEEMELTLQQLASAEERARSLEDGKKPQLNVSDGIADWLPNLFQRRNRIWSVASELNSTSSAGMFEAVVRGDGDTLKAALAKQENPAEAIFSARNDKGQTLLHAALANNGAEAAKFILEEGERFVMKIKFFYDLQGELLERQVATFVKEQDRTGCSPLQVLCTREEPAEEEEGVIVALLEASADPMSRDSEGITPFLECARSGNVSLMRLLLQVTWGAVMLDCDSESRSALHWGARSNKQKVVELLLKVKADADVADAEGLTPLEVATAAGHEEIAKLLKDGVPDSDDEEGGDSDDGGGPFSKAKGSKGDGKGKGKESTRMPRPDGDTDDFVGDFGDMDETDGRPNGRAGGDGEDTAGIPFVPGRVVPGGVLRPEGFGDAEGFTIDAESMMRMMAGAGPDDDDVIPPALFMAAMSQGMMDPEEAFMMGPGMAGMPPGMDPQLAAMMMGGGGMPPGMAFPGFTMPMGADDAGMGADAEMQGVPGMPGMPTSPGSDPRFREL